MRATAQSVCSYNVANAIDTTRKVQHLIISSLSRQRLAQPREDRVVPVLMVLTRMPRAQLMRLYKLLLDRVDTEAVTPDIVALSKRVLHIERVKPELGARLKSLIIAAKVVLGHWMVAESRGGANGSMERPVEPLDEDGAVNALLR